MFLFRQTFSAKYFQQFLIFVPVSANFLRKIFSSIFNLRFYFSKFLPKIFLVIFNLRLCCDKLSPKNFTIKFNLCFNLSNFWKQKMQRNFYIIFWFFFPSKSINFSVFVSAPTACPLTSRGLASVGDLVSQMYTLKTNFQVQNQL